MWFTFATSIVLLLIATWLISRKFGLWAGGVVAGAHIVNIAVDWLVVGNLTKFRLVFYSLYAFLLLVAYVKTVKKLNL